MDTSGTAGLADGIIRGIIIGATVVSSSAGIICALLWKDAMCARRNTPAAAASLSPSNTVSGTLQIMAKQLNRLDSSAMVPCPCKQQGKRAGSRAAPQRQGPRRAEAPARRPRLRYASRTADPAGRAARAGGASGEVPERQVPGLQARPVAPAGLTPAGTRAAVRQRRSGASQAHAARKRTAAGRAAVSRLRATKVPMRCIAAHLPRGGPQQTAQPRPRPLNSSVLQARGSTCTAPRAAMRLP